MSRKALVKAIAPILLESVRKGEYLGVRDVDCGLEVGDIPSHTFEDGAQRVFVVVEPSLITVWYANSFAAGHINYAPNEKGYADFLEALAVGMRNVATD